MFVSPVICKPVTLVVCSYFKEIGKEFGVKSLKSLAGKRITMFCDEMIDTAVSLIFI